MADYEEKHSWLDVNVISVINATHVVGKAWKAWEMKQRPRNSCVFSILCVSLSSFLNFSFSISFKSFANKKHRDFLLQLTVEACSC